MKKIPFIDEIINNIVSLCQPEQIILFGSFARGDNKDTSDIDLLILKKDLKNNRELTNLLYKAFFENNISIPIDLIAVDYDKYHNLKKDIGYIYQTIEKEGVVLYG